MSAHVRKLMRCAFAEFCATALFVFFGAGSVSASVQAASPGGFIVVEPINYAVSFGFGITILAFAVGDVSGAHINPAVTLALAVTGNLPPLSAVVYVFAQIAGGLLGGGLLLASLGPQLYKSGIGLNVGASGGLLFEFMGTLLLIFVVFNVAVWSGNPVSTDFGGTVVSALAPLPIGLAVMVAHLTLGPFTGCGINPARVIGAVVWEPGFWEGAAGKSFWIYIVGPFLASLAGPLTYLAMEGTVKPGSAGGIHEDKVSPEASPAEGAKSIRTPPATLTTVEAF